MKIASTVFAALLIVSDTAAGPGSEASIRGSGPDSTADNQDPRHLKSCHRKCGTHTDCCCYPGYMYTCRMPDGYDGNNWGSKYCHYGKGYNLFVSGFYCEHN